ncbi:twin-arginine translocase TatA/TatE family subunit [Jonesia quinghaiensis]|uniref:twin-arginine translocase TatA/TatE family subunit n=1 Tax=Jonesia quinghaiensis TaxID=262806 RepID=UPI0004220870
MIFGINGGEFLIILLVIVLVVGPERLPQYAEQLAQLVRKARSFMSDAKQKVDTELGPEFRDVDWQKLDPRQYDPRRIVRETLIEDTILDPNYGKKPTGDASAATAAVAAARARSQPQGPSFPQFTPLPAGQTPPFDTEAT